MGNNQAFTDFEATVLATYNKGVLDEALLAQFMERYRGTDIDHGGMTGDLSNDGLDVEEIVLKVFGQPVPTHPKLPKDHTSWTAAQEQTNDDYREARSAAFFAIASGRFGWR